MLKPSSHQGPHDLNTYNKMVSSSSMRPHRRRVLDDHDVEVVVSHCGVCHSHPTHHSAAYTHASSYITLPIVPDLGIVGTVTAVGKYVKHHQVGDRVGVAAIVSSCQDGPLCLTCSCDDEVRCRRLIATYGDKDIDGPRPFGGNSHLTQVSGHHAVKIPDALPSEAAASLFCAGAAVYKPLRDHVKPGQVVGVVGIGALGHLALQFILALEAMPIAFSTSPEKETSARWLGAETFVNTNNIDEIKRAKQTVDVLLVTSQAPDQPYDLYADWIKPGGTMVVIGASKNELKTTAAQVDGKNLTVVDCERGDTKDIKAMLDLAAEVGVRPIVESVHLDDASDAFERLHQGKARYSVVLRSC